tara:strand:- start:49 stop:216 length:168 start_codon:yes stop_codon:yes gene_type:complete
MIWQDTIKKNNVQLKEFLLGHLDTDIKYIQGGQEINPEHLRMRLEFYKTMVEKIQ